LERSGFDFLSGLLAISDVLLPNWFLSLHIFLFFVQWDCSVGLELKAWHVGRHMTKWSCAEGECWACSPRHPCSCIHA
jgi:hypothetical protein